jgi:hypothetical protein
MNEIIFSVTTAPEGGFLAQALGHSIYTEADDWIGLRAAVRDAVLCHFDEGKAPVMIRLHRATLSRQFASRYVCRPASSHHQAKPLTQHPNTVP